MSIVSVIFTEIQNMWPYTISGASLDYPSSNLHVIWYLVATFWICLWERGKGQHLSYPATSLVVLQVHQHASLLLRTSHVILLPLFGIHKLLGKTISILHIVPAATPQPVSGQVLGPGSPAAATAGELSFTASPADGVHHPGSTDGIGESSLSATCERDVRSKINERQISSNKRNTQQGASEAALDSRTWHALRRCTESTGTKEWGGQAQGHHPVLVEGELS